MALISEVSPAKFFEFAGPDTNKGLDLGLMRSTQGRDFSQVQPLRVVVFLREDLGQANEQVRKAGRVPGPFSGFIQFPGLELGQAVELGWLLVVNFCRCHVVLSSWVVVIEPR